MKNNPLLIGTLKVLVTGLMGVLSTVVVFFTLVALGIY